MLTPVVQTKLVRITTINGSPRTEFLYLINHDGNKIVITPEEFKAIVEFVYVHLPVYMEEFDV